jgi:hypothetical protein
MEGNNGRHCNSIQRLSKTNGGLVALCNIFPLIILQPQRPHVENDLLRFLLEPSRYPHSIKKTSEILPYILLLIPSDKRLELCKELLNQI